LLDAQTAKLRTGYVVGETIELSLGADIIDDGGSGLDGITSLSAPSVIAKVEMDGGSDHGYVTGWNVDARGGVYVEFNSGLVAKFGTLALARFPGEEHLRLGPDGTWRETLASGAPTFERPLTGGRGRVE
jgi:flagellar hook protein FlgE